MEDFLDRLWEYIEAGIQFLGNSLDGVLQHLHFLGPVVLISFLALCTIAVTKVLNRVIVTKRYGELEKNFQHWFQLRQEALKCEDREKGKRLARNIDQAELNRAYYDYFFEGFLLGLARRVMPIFFMFAFINEFYRAERLLEFFGRGYVTQLPSTSGEPIFVGAVVWYIISIIAGYLLWYAIPKIIGKLTSTSFGSVKPHTEESGC
ncbi:hypothetical protein [Desulfosediminicola ganghwensis]|uniref:hypothetical protein n=1 Tax=Desulfosediminicola ganghwensis TaxID=2569540 RepID=UPI0010AD516E|nr:hypothetical protein [Desulfosediminicola ganghwensis]